MAEATAAQPNIEAARASRLRQSQAISRREQTRDPLQGGRTVSPEAAQASQVSAEQLAARTRSKAPEPPKPQGQAEERGAPGRAEALRGAQQQKRRDLRQQAQEAKREAKATVSETIEQARKAIYQKRDQMNNRADKFAMGAAKTIIIPFAWFNLQLVWGHLVKKGKSFLIAPPSFKRNKIPLPDIAASGAVLGADFLLGMALFLAMINLLIIGFIMLIPIIGPAALIATLVSGGTEFIHFFGDFLTN